MAEYELGQVHRLEPPLADAIRFLPFSASAVATPFGTGVRARSP